MIRRFAPALAALLSAALVSCAGASPAGATAPLARLSPVLSTQWTGGVSTTSPLPDYPRPQLQRAQWLSLNGPWQYEVATPGEAPPLGRDLAQTILVPFPVQSPLSGIERNDSAGWYRRSFQIPPAWKDQRVELNFGAVSWAVAVWLNGTLVGEHRGDYGGFSLDITRVLRRRGQNELVVGYVNPMGGAGEPVGKQAPGSPSGLLHSASSGIWQTAWLEPVAAAHINGLELTPDLPHSRLLIHETHTGEGALTLRAQALAGDRTVASAEGPAGQPLLLAIPRPHLWSPQSPYLYGLRVQMLKRHTVIDHVTSYFGMRSISLGRWQGVTRILLNGHFLFQDGALDQGFWPDGLYTPPADAAMRFDIQSAERLGFNMLREHAKVQPDRWYMWADRLGLLVWQDMPNMPLTSAHAPGRAARAEFLRELREIVAQRASHPSVVSWVPFNEGWQQFDVAGVARQVRGLDSAALVDAQSGSANCCDALGSGASDLLDTHLYPGPFSAAPDARAAVIGEFGGVLPFPPSGHRWPGTLFSVGSPALEWSLRDITGELSRQYAMLAQEIRTGGLSGSVFTELNAAEQELGLISYDREVLGVDGGWLRALNLSLVNTTAGESPVMHAGSPRVPLGSVSFWPLDEGTGSGARNIVAPRAPLGIQAAGHWTRGRHGSALAMSGQGIAATTFTSVLDTRNSFTVSAWLRADRAGESGSAISQPGPDGSSFSLGIATEGRSPQARPGQIASGVQPPALRTWWTFTAPADPACPAVSCGVQANMHYDDGRLSVRPRTWHHVTGVYESSTRTLSVYVDGQPQDAEHIDAPPPSSGPLSLGAGAQVYGTGPDFFAGAIQDVRIYARALSPAEVWQLYRASG